MADPNHCEKCGTRYTIVMRDGKGHVACPQCKTILRADTGPKDWREKMAEMETK